MNRQVFIVLPAADPAKSMSFFKELGFDHNPEFTGDTAACIVISDTIYAMFVEHAKFTSFTPKSICDTKTSTEVLLTLSCSSREEVDQMVAKALSAGGSVHGEPDDYGFMYQHGFSDPDGHQWGLSYMSGPPPH
jgi:uncharacterized protein